MKRSLLKAVDYCTERDTMIRAILEKIFTKEQRMNFAAWRRVYFNIPKQPYPYCSWYLIAHPWDRADFPNEL